MNKFLLTFIISISFCITNAQVLQNTQWSCYTSSGSFFRYYSFGSDTAFWATNSNPITAYATYTENGNNLAITALSGCVGFAGTYTFVIQNDTLKFTHVNDPCAVRLNIFENYIWVNSITTSIKNNNNGNNIVDVYPNPSINGIYNLKIKNRLNEKLFFTVNNTFGDIVFQNELINKEDMYLLDLNKYPNGIYFLTVQTASSKKVLRLLK